MSYIANTPRSGQTLGNSRPEINTNFQDIAAAFAANHTPLTSSNLGRHEHVDMPAQASDPTPPATVVSHYSKQVGGITEWFFQREAPGSEVIQMSKGTPVLAQDGYTFLPGGLILSFGNRFGIGPVTFAYTSYTILYSVMVSSSAAGVNYTALSLSGLTFGGLIAPPPQFSYMVIGA